MFKPALIPALAGLLPALLCSVAPAHAGVIYVEADAPGPTHDASTWQMAYRDLQGALVQEGAGHQIRGAERTNIGTIVGWGSQIVGVDLSSGFVAVAGGYHHSLGLKADGSIVAWGNSNYGECNMPAPNTGVVAVAGGRWHSLALKADGSIVAWGYNGEGQCNIPAPNTGFVAVAGGYKHSLGLKADGAIVAWGLNGDGQCNVPAPNTGFVGVAAGYGHSLGMKANGSIVAWGRNEYGQCNIPAPNTGFVAVAGGALHSLGLKADGSIVAWGYNYYGQCTVPAPNTGFVAVTGGYDHSLGLKADGSIVAWGRNDYGQCNMPAPNTGFVAVAGGMLHSLGLKADGSIVAWGRNEYGQCNIPAPNTGFVAVAGGGLHSLGLKADGSIVAWGGSDDYGQCNVPAPNTGFVAVAGGYHYSLGLKADGSIVAWGRNHHGQCNVPAPNTGFVAVAAGHSHSLGMKADGSIVAWGRNDYGQCNMPAPNTGFLAVAGGGGHEHSLGLKADGSIVAWGRNDYGQCNVPAPNTGFVAVAGGYEHSLGLKADGSIVAWGDNGYGQCSVPAPNTGFVAVAGSGWHSLGLKANGSIVAWGYNAWGQCNVPAPNPGFVAVAVGFGHSLGLRADCNGDGIPDGTDVADGTSQDCNGNGVPDECDMAAGTSRDCQPDGIPDECQLDGGGGPVVISEGFDDITNLLGWFMQNNSCPLGSTNWFQGNSSVFPGQAGGGTSYIAADYNNTGPWWFCSGTISNWLLTPQVTLQNGMVLDFYTRGPTCTLPNCWADRLQVRMSLSGASTDVGTTCDSVGDFTTLLLDINDTYVADGYPQSWDAGHFTVTLSGIATPTSGRLALRYFVEDGGPCGTNSIYIGIDTVTLTGEPGLPSNDCNTNGIPDDCDVAGGTSPDANTNSVPDECDPTRFVDDDAPPGGDGLSWNTAFNYLQDALAAAAANPRIAEIRVAGGTYQPDRDAAYPNGTGSRTATFQQLAGGGLYGGYAGYGAPDPDARDLVAYETILSGDLAGDDVSGDFPNGPSYSENSYHVVTGSGTDGTAMLDGFTVTAGNANASSPHSNGGGMYTSGGSPTLTHCAFSGNSAYYGGGMYNGGGSPTLTHCTFSSNSAYEGGGGMANYSGSPTLTNSTFSGNSAHSFDTGGGGMYNYGGSPTLINCTFSGNSASVHGGGMYNRNYSTPTLTNCTFTGNSALYYGGGMANRDGKPTLTNCTFSGNGASNGGGMHNNNYYYGSPTLTNCTFSGNGASNGGGMYNGPWSSGPTLMTNCILWGNTAYHGAQIYGSAAVTYSDVEGGYGGVGNIAFDPLFVNAAGGDFRLSPGSPGIDAGKNAAVPADTLDLDGDGNTTEPIPFDLAGNPRFVDEPGTPDCPQPGANCGTPPIVDLGAYEYQPRDCNSNGVSDSLDLAAGTSPDCNGNGVPDECDMVVLHNCCASGHGRGCSDPAIEACVCEQHLFCCETEWNQTCVAEVTGLVCGSCAPSSSDCDANGLPDECETDGAAWRTQDCNGNRVPDLCDIVHGTSADADSNGIPDECAVMSCHLASEIAPPTARIALDVHVANVADLQAYQSTIHIQRTYGTNGTVSVSCPDGVLIDDTRPDFVFSGLTSVPATDCPSLRLGAVLSTGGVSVGSAPAYLGTYLLDISADAAVGSSFRISIRGKPDSFLRDSAGQPLDLALAPACDLLVEACQTPATEAVGSRYLRVTPAAGQAPIAVRVTSPVEACLEWYVDFDPDPALAARGVGRLGPVPVFRTPSEWATLYIGDSETVPDTSYEVQIECPGGVVTAPVSAMTWLWADVNHSGGPVDMDDILCLVHGFDGDFGTCSLWADDLVGQVPNAKVDGDDVLAGLDAFFNGAPYPYPDPCAKGAQQTEQGAGPMLGPVPMVPLSRTVLTVVPQRDTLAPGETVTVEVSISNAADLRGYQVALEAVGGTQGGLVLESLSIDPTRGAYVFAGLEDVRAVDLAGQRLAAALPAGGIACATPKYAGTYVFRATPDAAGTFPLRLRLGADTFLRDSLRQPIGLHEAVSTTVTVVPGP